MTAFATSPGKSSLTSSTLPVVVGYYSAITEMAGVGSLTPIGKVAAYIVDSDELLSAFL